MAKSKTVFFCTDCGNEVLRWQGQCPAGWALPLPAQDLIAAVGAEEHSF